MTLTPDHDNNGMPFARAGVRRAKLAAIVTAVAISAAGVVTGTAAAASSQGAPPIPVLDWRACDAGFECATARVPLDYRYPDGQTIKIAMVMHPAADHAAHPPVLFVNSGGPSEQIEPLVASFPAIPAALAERFDIVTFDPRGFGFSSAVRCFPSTAAENQFLANLPAFPVGARQDATWVQTYARFDSLCAQRGGSLLDHDTTADVARDMDLLRAGMGTTMLNYVGLSYGTGLGATYANLFPDRVGHMVLDGNLDPVAWTSGGPLPSGLRRGADQATAATMQSFLNLCGEATTSACAFSAGTPAATTGKWQTLLSRLLANPVTVEGQTYTYAGLLTSVPLGTVSDWQQGGVLLQALWSASEADTAAQAPASAPAAVQAAQPAASAPSVYTGVEQEFATLCTDTADPREPAAYVAAAQQASARAGGFGLFWAWTEEACANWPGEAGQDRYTGPWNRWTASPILVIGITGDPATPYSGSVAMARDLARARLLTVDGYGHTEFANPSTCATDDEVRYLTTGALPAAGSVCAQDGTPF